MPFRLEYPVATKVAVIDDYHGVKVGDPYRWLEDARDPATIAWVDAENALTRRYLDGPVRDTIARRLWKLYDYPRVSVPFARRGRYFFLQNSGLQNQPVLCVQDRPDGSVRTLLDPNALDPDGTTAITVLSPSEDGTLVTYGLSVGGSDVQEIRVREVESGVDRPDRLQWAKFSTIAWTRDGGGFYYTRFPEPGSVPPGEEQYWNSVRFHRLGEDQSHDRLIVARPDDREIVFQTAMTADRRLLVVTAFRGASDRSEVVLVDTEAPDAPTALFAGFGAAYQYVGEADGRLLFRTDEGAPLGRLIAVDRGDPGAAPVEVIPEGPDTLVSAVVANHRLVASFLRNASSVLEVFTGAGEPLGPLALPSLGTVTELSGRPDDPFLFFSFSSFTHQPTVYRWDFGPGPPQVFPRGTPLVDAAAYETTQVWYASKDGTRVSMFLVHRRDLARDGRRPVLLSGYGGFNISLSPAFDPAIFVWLDRGGVFALANLRGGGEYGEAWHRAGMRERKPAVFDDFAAAAEWLIASGYASPSTLAVEGGSNGGLLVGALLVQRPDLVGAVVCRVPVADMLRYHLFTVGRFWIPEYGSSDDPALFPVLYDYSPLHNVRDGVRYPATLVTTADTDDRVAPGMAKKFAARLQAATAGSAPILIRVETRAGHGAGKPVSKMIDEDADIFAFLYNALDITTAP
jgi:prolyl oligopeptidase